ncbi:MAG: hypothetical protein KAH32_04770 [Chlamydiia bacterium]|nr:hypothetical protein [Chlamydiia bacterium]
MRGLIAIIIIAILLTLIGCTIIQVKGNGGLYYYKGESINKLIDFRQKKGTGTFEKIISDYKKKHNTIKDAKID